MLLLVEFVKTENKIVSEGFQNATCLFTSLTAQMQASSLTE